MTGHFVAATGEFVGTFMFLFFAFSCQIMLNTQASDTSLQNGRSSSQTNVFIALIYGLSLLVNVWAFFRISGGLFNPAVSNSSDRGI
jgi:aquaporin related protein